jgi:hypothetical protein
MRFTSSKNNRDIESIYKATLLPSLLQLKAEQSVIRVKLIILLLSGTVFGVALYLYLDRSHPFLFALPMIGAACFAPSLTKKFQNRYKKEVIEKFFCSFFEQCSMHSDKYILKSDFEASELFGSYNQYSGEDFVQGKIDGLSVQLSELNVRMVTGSGKNKKSRKVFKGVFFQVKVLSAFRSTLLLRPDLAERFLGKYLGQMIQGNPFEQYPLVKLESTEFERYYKVHSNSQIESRKVLTPAVLQRFVDFRKKYKHAVYLSLKQDQLRVAIDIPKNLFESRIFSSLLNMKDYEEIKELIDLIHEILATLKLNSRS